MKRVHLIFGLVLVVVFILTGQYMEYVHNRTLSDGMRVLYRSRHIYLLLNALINISLGLYVEYDGSGWRRRLQVIGSILIMIAPAFLLAGFFYEPPRGADQTIMAPYGIFATAIGILLHLISAIRKGR
jgi:MFS-type transporter involved in bile tolerance (Atg22 family)